MSKTLRVLVVDDNLDTVRSTANSLRDRGYEVDFAINGIAALFIAQRFRPQVVLLDIGLPDADGVDLARQMRHHPELKNARLIAMTGRGEETRTRALQGGCDDFFVKPLDAEKLEKILSGIAADG
jgi:two-component system OmpR family response regulator